jgi:hypothetical protein
MELGRPYSPITAGLSWHDVEMEVWRELAAIHAIVLEGENPERLIGYQQRLRNFSRCFDDSRSLLVGQIQ